MLRVRPVIATPSAKDYAALLQALGLHCVEEHCVEERCVEEHCVEEHGGWQLFDSGNGKVALQSLPEDGHRHATVRFGFELRDAAIFVQRTLADGTRAELLVPEPGSAELWPAIPGPAAKVTAPDGFSFWAHPSTDLSLPRSQPARSQLAGSQLTVVQTWRTPRPAEANTVLSNIGARPVRELAGGGALFRAKNGGLAATAQGGDSGVEVGFMYDGELSALAARLAAAGVTVTVDGEVLKVDTPDGGRLAVAAGQQP